jgi:hypothetical protein
VFYLDVHICLQWFSIVFANVSNACFKCFICLFLYVAIVASGCFKSRSSVVHGMCVGSRRGHEQSPHGQCSGGVGPCVGMGDAGVVKRSRGDDAGPRVDAQNREEIDGSRGRPDV